MSDLNLQEWSAWCHSILPDITNIRHDFDSGILLIQLLQSFHPNRSPSLPYPPNPTTPEEKQQARDAAAYFAWELGITSPPNGSFLSSSHNDPKPLLILLSDLRGRSVPFPRSRPFAANRSDLKPQRQFGGRRSGASASDPLSLLRNPAARCFRSSWSRLMEDCERGRPLFHPRSTPKLLPTIPRSTSRRVEVNTLEKRVGLLEMGIRRFQDGNPGAPSMAELESGIAALDADAAGSEELRRRVADLKCTLEGKSDIELRLQSLQTAVTHFLEDAPGALTKDELSAILEIARLDAQKICGPGGQEIRDRTESMRSRFEKAAELKGRSILGEF